MRLFVSVEVSDELKENIIEIQKRFNDFDIKFVEKQNLHFCLKFLGEVEESKIDQIKEVLSKLPEQFEKFKIKIAGLNAFPNKNYIKVLFLEVKDGRNEMVALAEVIESKLGKSDKQFIPHLTLGRVKSGKNKEKLKELIKELENIEIGEMVVDKIKLIKSELTPSGPVYGEVFAVSL